MLSSCRTRILDPRRRFKGMDDTLLCVCRLKVFYCLKNTIWLWRDSLLLSYCVKASAFLVWYSTEIEGHPRPKSLLFSLIITVGVLFMNLCFLIMLPVLLSYSLSRSGSQGVTWNAYAMLGMIAVFITCMACQGEVSFWGLLVCVSRFMSYYMCVGVSSWGS